MNKNLMMIFIASIAISGCHNNHPKINDLNLDTPIVSVVKLISAESIGNISEAEKFISIEQVYSQHIKDDVDLRKIWIDQVEFKSFPNRSAKVANCFDYYNYDISEKIDNDFATVYFIKKQNNSSIQSIEYSLELVNKKWKVIKIEYLKN